MSEQPETQLIKTVASAYFVYIPATPQRGYWINLANVLHVTDYPDEKIIQVKYSKSESSVSFDGESRDILLEALREVSKL